MRDALGGTAVSDGVVDWRIAFAEVFENGGGFDVVIANPPYVDSETMTLHSPEDRQKLAAMYKTTKGNWDYYIPFWERSFGLASNHGISMLITPNKWLASPYGKALREHLRAHVDMIADFSRFRVFDAAGVFPIILMAKKMPSLKPINTLVFQAGFLSSSRNPVDRKMLDKSDSWGLCLSPYAKELSIWLSEHSSLTDICKVEEAFTVSQAYELVRLIVDDNNFVEKHFKFINTGTIDPFQSLWGMKPTRYLKTKYLHPIISESGFAQEFPRRFKQMKSAKIVLGGIGKLEAYYDVDGTYVSGKSTVVVRNWISSVSPWFLVGFLNSATAKFVMRECYSVLAMGGSITYRRSNVGRIPVPLPNLDQQEGIGVLAKDLHELISSNGDSRRMVTITRELDDLFATAIGASGATRAAIMDLSDADKYS